MVSVHTSHAFSAGNGQADFRSWLESLAVDFRPQEQETILRACELAQTLYAGEPGAMEHALGTAAILAHQRMDYESIAAAVLQGVTGRDPDWAVKVTELFGASIAGLVDGVARMDQIREYAAPGGGDKREQGAHIESLRKMLLAMVED
ncbi:MAG: HD domain-containing protein, partial [Sulfuricella sp.]|nr:HD domain-containing protein [Sulfuricella sp.]